MSELTERLIRARDSLGDDGRRALTQEHRDTLADAINALEEQEALERKKEDAADRLRDAIEQHGEPGVGAPGTERRRC